MTKRFLYAIPAMLAASAVGTNACSPLPLPPPPDPQYVNESGEDYKRRVDAYYLDLRHKDEVAEARRSSYSEGYENGLWDSARIAAVVEIVAHKEGGYGSPEEGGPQTTLKVIKAVKGNPDRKPFKIGYEGMTSCGPYGHVNLVGGSIGDRFVIFAKARKLTADTIIIGYSKSEAKNYRTKELLSEPAPGAGQK